MVTRSLLVVLLILIPSAHAVIFNEVMYDVIGSDTDQEWFEIYNNDDHPVDIDNWKFFEDGVNHNINVVQGSYTLDALSYAVIAEDAVQFLINYPDYTGVLFDSTFTLSNSGETIVLKNQTDVQDNLTYTFVWGGQSNGFTTGLYQNTWQETLATPGEQNELSNICDWKVSIESDFIFDEDDFDWKIIIERLLGPSTSVKIKRSIEDAYGNEIKTYGDLDHTIVNKETLSYTPNLKVGTYLLKAEINPDCNESDTSNNNIGRLIAVTEERDEDSSLEIEDVLDLGSDDAAKFGQLIKVKLNAYRSDITKESVSVWVENDGIKVSKVLTFKVEDEFKHEELTLPIQLFSNCNSEYEDGRHSVIAKGLGEQDSKTVYIYNKTTCEKEVIIKEKILTQKEKAEQLQQIFQFNDERPFAVSTVVFESTQRKAEKLVPTFIIILMSLTVTYLLFSRKGA